MSVVARLPVAVVLSLSYPLHNSGVLSFSPAAMAAPFAPQRSAEPSGSAAWVARQVQDRDTGRDVSMELRMRLYDRQGRARDRVLTMRALRGAARVGAQPGAPPGDRVLVQFTYPGDIRGTAFLVWEHPAADDERFLYLPALGRVRRIASEETQESFVGSDFTYEDIGGREFEDYSYEMIERDAVWTAGGTTAPAYRIESRRRDAGARFPRVVSLVLKDRFVVVHAEIHNRRDEREKIFDVGRLERIENVWTAMEMQMVNEVSRTRTELTVVRVDYNVGLKADDFSRRALELR